MLARSNTDTHVGFFIPAFPHLPIVEAVCGPADLAAFHAALVRRLHLQENEREAVVVFDLCTTWMVVGRSVSF